MGECVHVCVCGRGECVGIRGCESLTVPPHALHSGHACLRLGSPFLMMPLSPQILPPRPFPGSWSHLPCRVPVTCPMLPTQKLHRGAGASCGDTLSLGISLSHGASCGWVQEAPRQHTCLEDG